MTLNIKNKSISFVNEFILMGKNINYANVYLYFRKNIFLKININDKESL